jgi:cell division septation protein DedD
MRPDTVSIRQQDDHPYNDDTVSISSNSLRGEPQSQTENSPATNSATTKKEVSPGVWLQLILLLISAALLVSTLFRLDAQANDVENSLSVYDEKIDEKIQESVDFQKQNTSDGTTKINATLHSLQEELQTIKTDYSALDKKYVAMVQNQASEKTQDSASILDDVSVFKYEILSLKSELQAVKSKLQITKPDKSQATKTAAGNGLTITLASLTNRIKAEKIVQQLHEEGLLPTIEQAIVKGERVYRLSVSGFVNRDEAESFILKADKKYGMKNSRIRKS